MLPLLLLSGLAPAATASRAVLPRPLLGHPVLELRLGADLAANGSPVPRPTVCAELSPHARLGLEACGNGGGTWHQEEIPGIMHLRARLGLLRLEQGPRTGELLVGAGVAEIQTTADEWGLRFGPAEPGAVEAAGPELSLHARGRAWIHERAFLSGELNAGAAHVPGAPEVIGQGGPLVPFLGLSGGLGF